MSRREEAKSEELRVYRQDYNGEEREELAAVGTKFGEDKSEEDYNEESIGATGKFFNGNTRIVIVPKILESSTVASDDQPDDKDDGAIGKRSGNPRLKSGTIYFFDCLVAALLVGPMVVAHWRGIWVLMDFHQDIFTGWLCFCLGMSLHFLFAVLKQPLHRAFAQDANSKGLCARLGCRLIRTVYIYLFSLACNCHWRGVWILLNDLFGVQAGIIGCFTCAILGDLTVLRCLRNLLAPPFLVTLDSPRFVFRFPTRYRTNTRDWSLYILDCAFSVGVVGTLVVFVWRGAWVLFDLYLFPENREHSAIGSLILGYILVAVTFSLQPLMRYACSRLTGLARLIAADGFLLLSFIGTVNVWRGIWNVLDLWLLPEDPKLSCWITHLGCFVFLVLLNCSNSVLVRGVYIDAEEEAGKCVVFPCHYLRMFFKIEREKKEARRRNLIVASRDLGTRGDPSGKDAENGALLVNSSVTPIIQPANPESHV